MGGVKDSQEQDVSYIRKIRKPLVEKKRRERMNKSISLLKSLISTTIQQNTAPMTRVDKADILELTVLHLTQLQQQQQSVKMATETAAFSTGYKACAREAVTYLANNKMTSDTVAGSLSNHLHNAFLANIRRQGTANTFHRNISTQNDRLSTPLRQNDTFNMSLPELNLSGYSPILTGTQALPELTSSFVHASLDSSSSSGFSSTCSLESSSSSPSSGFSSTCSLETSSSSESYIPSSDNTNVHYSCTENEAKEIDSFVDVVTIGNGKENEIGHVIKEVPWRPF